MKINDIDKWNNLAYELIYPALLGSMIYDLMPQSSVKYFTVKNFIKIVIVLFYILDFLHLYGDLKAKENKSWLRLILDLLVSFIFVGIFVLVKLDLDELSLFSLIGIPLVFFCYKLCRKSHIPFHLNYLIFSVALIIGLWFLKTMTCWKDFLPDWVGISLLVILGMLVTYCIYVFKLFDKQNRVA